MAREYYIHVLEHPAYMTIGDGRTVSYSDMGKKYATLDEALEEVVRLADFFPVEKLLITHKFTEPPTSNADAKITEEQEARLKALRGASVDALVSLVAAVSLLKRGGKKAAASDKMFTQMVSDYEASIERCRAALNGQGDEGKCDA